MNKTLLAASALVAALLSSPASAQKHKVGDFCQLQAPDCDRKRNALWLCHPIINPYKKEGDAQLYHWERNGVCSNNLDPGDDMDTDKNIAKEKANGEARRKKNQKTIDDEKAEEREAAKKAADKNKKTIEDSKKAVGDKKKAPDDKNADDAKKATDAKKAAADKKAADKKAEDDKKAADKKAADKKAADQKAKDSTK
jgi:hypothetical protein